jgi:ABC-type multidrug transport system fused ATPase/permease subunit
MKELFCGTFASSLATKVANTKQLSLNVWDLALSRKLALESLQKVFSFSIGQHFDEHSGVNQNILTKGTASMLNFVNNMLNTILPGGLQVVTILFIVAWYDWRVALTACLFTIVYFISAHGINKKFYPEIDDKRKKRQRQGKIQNELYRNAPLVISEAGEMASLSYFKEFMQSVDTQEQSMWLRFLNYFYANRICIIVGQYATIAVGLYLVATGHHSPGSLLALFVWARELFGNLESIMYTQRLMLFAVADIQKFFSFCEIKSAIPLQENALTIANLQGEITYTDVCFGYKVRPSDVHDADDDMDTLHVADHAVSGISFTIPAGSTVGFVGLSGSGKSTILNLLRRYYDPLLGEILIDGVPLVDLDLQWYRRQIGNVDQDIKLFDQSIRANILLGADPNTSEEVLQKAIDNASLRDFIDKLPAGVDTLVGEGGIKVSGGERQRIGIARALVKNPKILIFDEATSSLDAFNEALIHDAIMKNAHGRTTIIIAHRLSTVRNADCIFVVSEGKIVGQGTHDELLVTCRSSSRRKGGRCCKRF